MSFKIDIFKFNYIFFGFFNAPINNWTNIANWIKSKNIDVCIYTTNLQDTEFKYIFNNPKVSPK